MIRRKAFFAAVLVGATLVACTPANKDFTSGKIHFNKQRWEEAQVSFQAAEAVMPPNADLAYFSGVTALRLDDYAGARKYFDQAMELTPGKYDKKIAGEIDREYVDLYNDGKRFAEQEDIERSLERFNDAVTLAPGRGDAYGALGSVYANAGDFGKAAESFESALAITPDDSILRLNLGVVLVNAEDYETAMGHLKTVVDADPSNGTALNLLAACYQQAERFDEIVPVYEKLIALNPDSPDAHFNYGYALRKGNRLEEAAGQFEEVVRLAPEDDDSLLELARIYRDLERWADALGRLDVYIGRQPESPNGYMEKARVYVGWAESIEGTGGNATDQRRNALENLTKAGNLAGEDS